MSFLKNTLFAVAALSLIASCQSCKTKKLPAKSTAVTEVQKTQEPAATPQTDTPTAKPSMLPMGPQAIKPNFNFRNIQFEFNSAVLKTGSIQLLDHAAAEMKKDPDAKFVLNGNSSAEGTATHNMQLSVQRAAAVKTYLVNSGINEANLTVKGYGESKPIAGNDTEEGRALNRRVEIKVNQSGK